MSARTKRQREEDSVSLATLEKFLEVSQSLLLVHDLEPLLQQIAESAGTVLKADVIALYEYHEEEEDVTSPPVRWREIQRPEIPTGRDQARPQRESIVFRMLERTEPFYAANAGEDWARLIEDWREQDSFVHREGIVSSAAIPLIADEQRVGVLFVNYQTRHAFPEAERKTIELFATQAAIAIQNARLLEQERDLRRQTATLREASSAISSADELEEVVDRILDGLGQIVDYRTASLQLIRGDTRTLIASRGFDRETVNRWFLRPISQDPLIKRVVAGKEPLILSKPSKDPDWGTHADTSEVKSWIGLPLIHHQEVVGLLTLDHDQPGFYKKTLKRKLAAFANEVAVDIRNVRVFDSTQRRIRDLEIINEVAQAIGTKLEIENLLHTIVSQITNQLDCTHCTLFFPKEEEGELVLVPQVTYGVRSKEIMTRRFRPSDGLAGWVFRHGESLVLENAMADSRFAPARDKQDQPRSMLVAPVKVGDQTIGVISADQDAFGWFSESDRRLVDALARQAGIAIERAAGLKLLRDIGNRIISAQQVDEILEQIVSGAIELTHTTSGIIYLIGKDAKSVTKSFWYPPDFEHPEPRIGEEKGLTHYVISTGEPLVLPDISRNGRVSPSLRGRVRSMIATPLKYEGKTIGVLYLNDEKPHDFTETEQSLLSTLASQAAVAIENARLFEQVSEEVDQRQRAQEELAQEQHLLRTLIDNLPDLIYAKDTESRFTLCNAAVARLVGKDKPGEVLGKTDFDFFPRNLAQQYRADEEKILHSGQPLIDLEEPVVDSAGSERWVLTTKVPLQDSQGNVVGLVGLNRDITERKQAEQASEERATQLERLQQVTTKISAGPPDLDGVLQLIVESLGDIFQDASCTIRLYDSGADRFEPKVATGLLASVVEAPPRADGVSRHVIRTKEPRYIEGKALAEPSDGGPAVRQDILNRGIKASAHLPLTSEGAVIGVLYVDLTTPHTFSPNERRILELFADQAAIAIENARLFQELGDTATQFERLQAVTATISTRPSDVTGVLRLIVDGLGDIFPGASCAIRLYDSKTGKFTPQVATGVLKDLVSRDPRLDGTSGYVTETKRARYLEGDELALPPDGGPALRKDIREQGVKAAAYLPLLSEGDVIGILYVDLTTPHQFSKSDKRILELFAGQTTIAIENARLYEQRVKDMAALQEINSAIRDKELEEIGQLVAQRASELTGATYGMLWMLDGENQCLRIGAVSGREQVSETLPLDDNSINGHVALTGEPYLCNDVRLDSHYTKWFDDIQSNLTVPLQFREQLIGTLHVESTRVDAFTEYHRDLLQSLGDQAAIAIENARLLTELDERATRLVQLQHVTAAVTAEPSDLEKVLGLITRNLSDMFQGASCAIRLWDPTQEELGDRFAVGALKDRWEPPRPGGTSLSVIKTRTPLYIEDTTLASPDGQPAVRQEFVEQGVRAIAYLPLISGESVIGILYLNLTAPHQFTHSDRQILELFASQATIAIENARLYKAEQERRHVAETLCQGSIVLSSSLDLDTVLESILQQLRKAIPYDSASVQRLQGEYLEIVDGYGFEDLDEVIGRRFPIDPEFPNYAVVIEQMPLAIQDATQDYPHIKDVMGRPRSWLGAPLVVQDRVTGMIALDRTAMYPFTDEDANLALAFASQAAIALENARLYQELDQTNQELAQANQELARANRGLDRRVRELEVLTKIGRTVSNLGVDQILDLVYEQAGKIMDLSDAQVQIAFYDETKDEVSFPLAMEQDNGETIDVVCWSRREDKYKRLRFRAGLDLQRSLEENNRKAIIEEFKNHGIDLEPTDAVRQTEIMKGEKRVILWQVVDTYGNALYDIVKEKGEETLEIWDGDVVKQFRPRERGTRRGLNENVINTQQPLLITGDRKKNFLQKAEDLEITVWPTFGVLDRPTHSWLGVPMMVAGRVIGVISVQSLEMEQAFDVSHQELLDTVADQAAVAVENARLYQELDQTNRSLDRRVGELEVLTEIGRTVSSLGIDQILDLVYDQAGKIVDLSNAQVQIAFYDKSKDEVSFPLAIEQDEGKIIDVVRWSKREEQYREPGEDEVVKQFMPRVRGDRRGLNEYVINTQQPLLITGDPDKDFQQKATDLEITVWPTFGRKDRPTHSWLGVPMTVAGRVIGVISFQSLEMEQAFDEDHQELLTTIASQAAVAIENARLLDQEKKWAAQRILYEERKRREAEQWAYMGKIAGSLAHRIGNKGGMIRLCVQDLDDHLRSIGAKDAWITEQLDTIARSNQYLLGLSDLLFKPRKAVADGLEESDAIHYLEDALRYSDIPDDIQVVCEYADDLPPVYGNKYLVEAFLELIVNAVDAMQSSPQKKLTISANATSEWIELRFADTGSGLFPEDNETAFELFARGTDERLSTEGHLGFGLWWVRSFLQEIGGDIGFEGSPGGTTFFVRLPMVEEGHNA